MAITINGTTGISGVDGSAATPALQGADTNTGISFGTDTVTINTGGVARVTTNASGSVGIGTSAPVTRLHVASSATEATIKISNSTTGATATDGFDLIAAGNDTYVWNRENGPMLFGTNNAERMRIDSSGNLLVGKTGSAFGKFEVAAAAECGAFQFTGTAGTFRFLNASAGTIGSIQWSATTTSYNTSSDYRLKESIAPMTGALAKNELLNPVTYKWKADGSDGQGFIAHELQAVFPDAVTGEKDAVDADGSPQYQGVDTSFLVGHLVACVKELKSELDSVKAELATLKGAA